MTLHPDGTFTDYNEHLWDLKQAWVTEGVDCIVYAGTYTLEKQKIQMRYTKIVSKVTDVVLARESLAADEPLEAPVTADGILSADGTALTVKPFDKKPGGEGAEAQTLVAREEPYLSGGGNGKYG